MSSEHERQQSRLRGEQIEQSSEAPWADLELTVPNERSQLSIVSFVECVLVELTHEEVGAEYVSTNVWGTKRTQFISIDDNGEMFQQFRGGAPGLKERVLPTSRKREASRPGRKPTTPAQTTDCSRPLSPTLINYRPYI
ncbi:hypothetical protein [Halobellus sp. Atlit-38R]|uniref:hypothetical protein n=1 Tax=Halobellus sp. Atlit-38R TaxID=2282131 RepID=UPI0018F519A3|nr:hypothetical protein [Halobellus sp. Atlit-38R]